MILIKNNEKNKMPKYIIILKDGREMEFDVIQETVKDIRGSDLKLPMKITSINKKLIKEIKKED